MKKFLLAIVAVLGIGMAAAAQTDISVSYGGYTQMDACDNHDNWPGVNTAWGALNAGVNFHVAPNLWIGPSYTFSSTTQKGSDSGKIAYHAILLNGKYYYYSNSILRVYAHLGIGAVISHLQPYFGDSYNKGYFAMQISPVGVDVPLSPKLKIFGEAGFGAQGLLQVGVRIGL